MKLLALALALALASSALADGPGKTIGSSPSKLIPARPSGTACSTVIPDDANTVFHLYVCGGAVLDTKSNAISEVGTLTRVAKTALGFPNGKSAEGLTGFSSINYLSVAQGPLNPSNTSYFITALVQSGNVLQAGKIIVAGYSGGQDASARGYRFDLLSQDASNDRGDFISINGFTGQTGITGNLILKNNIHLLSYGMVNNSGGWEKDDVSATTSNANASLATAGSNGAQIGYSPGVPPMGGQHNPFDGTIFEVRLSTTTPSAAVLDALHTATRN